MAHTVKKLADSRQLPAKHAKFVAEYLIDLNATQAAIRAGYSPKTAKQQGSRLLTNADVASAIAAGAKVVLDDSAATAKQVLTELTRVALSDARAMFDDRGALASPADWPDHVASAISGVEVTRRYVPGKKDEDGEEIETTKVRRWDKPRCLELLAKYHNLLTDQVKHSGEVALTTKVVHEYHEAPPAR